MKGISGIIKTIIFLGIGGLLLWLTFRNQDIGLVIEKIKHAHFGWLGFSVVLSIFALISRSLRWNQLIEPLGYRPRLKSTFSSVMFGYMANLAIPRLGEITRCGSLSKAEEIPFEKLVGTVIVERVADVIMLAVCIGAVAILEFKRLGGFLSEHVWGPIFEKANASPFIIVGIVAVLIIGLLGLIHLLRMKNPPAAIEKIRLLIKGIIEGLASVTQLKNKWLFVFHSLFIWIMYFLMTYICFFALDATSKGLDLSAGLFMMVLGGIGMTAPVQGGIGTYHLLVSKGMELYGISETDGIVFATMVHSTQTLLLIILGGISMVSLFLFTKPRPSQYDVTSRKD